MASEAIYFLFFIIEHIRILDIELDLACNGGSFGGIY